MILVALAGSRGAASGAPPAFVDAEVGSGISTLNASQGLCGSYAAASGTLAMLRGGLGGGVFVSDDLALVVRAHATDSFPSPHALAFALFLGAGLQIRIAQLSSPRDYVYAEVVPGYEAASTPEVGNDASLGIAARVGLYRSWGTVALAATLMIDPAPRTYTQQDIGIVFGVHL